MFFAVPISLQSLIIFTVRKTNTISEELIFMEKQQRRLAWSDVLIMFTKGLTSRIIFQDHFKSSDGNVAGDPLYEGKRASICQKNNGEP